MTDKPMMVDAEMLRLVLRACNSKEEYFSFLSACYGRALPQGRFDEVLAKVKADVEMMEHQSISSEDLLQRIKVAKPENPIQI